MYNESNHISKFSSLTKSKKEAEEAYKKRIDARKEAEEKKVLAALKTKYE